jgi:hypothetical protein
MSGEATRVAFMAGLRRIIRERVSPIQWASINEATEALAVELGVLAPEAAPPVEALAPGRPRRGRR